jgi:chromate transporter
MFLPAFSFTIIGHKYFERAVQYKPITAFLDGVTASVVGLIIGTAFDLAKTTIEVSLVATTMGR